MLGPDYSTAAFRLSCRKFTRIFECHRAQYGTRCQALPISTIEGGSGGVFFREMTVLLASHLQFSVSQRCQAHYKTLADEQRASLCTKVGPTQIVQRRLLYVAFARAIPTLARPDTTLPSPRHASQQQQILTHPQQLLATHWGALACPVTLPSVRSPFLCLCSELLRPEVVGLLSVLECNH